MGVAESLEGHFRNINNLNLDVAEISRELNDLIAILRSNGIIHRP